MGKSQGVSVAGARWTITERLSPDQVNDKYILGHTIPATHTIHLRKELIKQVKREVLAHELVHAWLSQTGAANLCGKKMEEVICDAVSGLVLSGAFDVSKFVV